jgi:hypothetical protein
VPPPVLHQVAQAQEGGANGGSGAEAARGAALASLQREEAKLAEQANKLHAEVGFWSWHCCYC